MKLTKPQLQKIIKEELLKEFGLGAVAGLGALGYGAKKAYDWMSGPGEEAGEHGSGVDKMAWDLYRAMKGWGTNEELIQKTFQDIKSPAQLKAVIAAFDKVLQQKGKTDDGDLADWLEDDGMEQYAQIVKKVQSMPDAPTAPTAATTAAKGAGGAVADAASKVGSVVQQQVDGLIKVIGPESLSKILAQVAQYLMKQGPEKKE